MDNMDYIEKNKAAWNAKTAYHVASDFYGVKDFINGQSSLNDIELSLLGDIKNKSIIHLQCHFGQDTISLARLGAKVTGVDFSDAAIEQARVLAKKTKTSVDFICSDIYELPGISLTPVDRVFTSYGTIGWLPDMDRWAKIVASLLKPGGELVLVEFHPVVWMYDNDFTRVEYSYFNEAPIVEEIDGTYADRAAPLKNETISWNHPLSEVLNSLITNGLSLITFNEYDYSPYNCLNGMVETEPGKFRIEKFENRVPLLYAIKAVKS